MVVKTPAIKKVGRFTGEQAFYLQEGEGRTIGVAETIMDLREMLSRASDDVFKHHLREGSNDFASWAKSVVKDASLAKNLQAVNLKGGIADAKKKLLNILKEA